MCPIVLGQRDALKVQCDNQSCNSLKPLHRATSLRMKAWPSTALPQHCLAAMNYADLHKHTLTSLLLSWNTDNGTQLCPSGLKGKLARAIFYFSKHKLWTLGAEANHKPQRQGQLKSPMFTHILNVKYAINECLLFCTKDKITNPVLVIDDLDYAAMFVFHGGRGHRLFWLHWLCGFFL